MTTIYSSALLANRFLKLAGEEGDANSILMNIVETLNEYEASKDIEVGRRVLKMLDEFGRVVADKVFSDYLESYQASKVVPRESLHREVEPRKTEVDMSMGWKDLANQFDVNKPSEVIKKRRIVGR